MALAPFLICFQSCDVEGFLEKLGVIDQTGWLADDEDMDNIPEDITPFDDNTNNLASKISLENKFPPIGNQGNYGTCVAWSVGYNLKTSLNAIEKGWSSSQLASNNNQTSPYDVWKAIPSSEKGSKCDGTYFETALDALIKYGGASLRDVPYTATLNCSDKAYKGNTDNKLANYRKIASETEGLTPNNFKGYLNAGRPIAFGARLGDRFMSWNSSSVISSDTYNDPGMQHAYHAMALVGYDDAKNAFRVRNSWGNSWGDDGSIWIDYNFFCRSFCYAAFVAQNPSKSLGSSGTTGVTGADVFAYFAEDYPSSAEDLAAGRDRKSVV
jgi:C1A family cysteine protease